METSPRRLANANCPCVPRHAPLPVEAAFTAWCDAINIQTPFIRLVGGAPSAAEAEDAAVAASAAARTGTSPPSTSGRTAVAAVSLRAGDCVASIPDDVVLTVKASRAGPALRSAGLGNAAGNAWREAIGLGLALQAEAAAGRDSPWAPYVAWLAAAVPGLRATHPALWPSDQRRALLAGAAAGARLGKGGHRRTEHAPAGLAAAAALAAAFTARHPDLFAPTPPLTFLEAYTLVAAYSFTLGSDPPIAALVPVWDGLDHDAGVWCGGAAVALDRDPDSGCLTMRATRPIPPGGVVFNCYGDALGPGECVRRYGWAPPAAAAPGERLSIRPAEVGAAALTAFSRPPRPALLKAASRAAASGGGGRPLCVDGQTGEPSPGLVDAAAAAAGAGGRRSKRAVLLVLAAVAEGRAAAWREGGRSGGVCRCVSRKSSLGGRGAGGGGGCGAGAGEVGAEGGEGRGRRRVRLLLRVLLCVSSVLAAGKPPGRSWGSPLAELAPPGHAPLFLGRRAAASVRVRKTGEEGEGALSPLHCTDSSRLLSFNAHFAHPALAIQRSLSHTRAPASL